jgi:hypothetical protein
MKELNIETEHNKTHEQQKHWINHLERMIDEIMPILVAEYKP